MNNKVIIIAEAGVNHNGKILNAIKLIDQSKKIGADYIKFQYFKADKIVIKKSKLAKYQKKNINNKLNDQYNLLKKLEFTDDQVIKIVKYANSIKQKIFFSVFDKDDLAFISQFNFDYIKIPSGEINNYPLLLKIAKLNKKIILSTGMSDLKDISFALNTMLKAGLAKKNINLLHCNTEYPTPLIDINMRAMITIQKKFKINNIGYSDHSNNYEIPIVATALGAKIIEKHFTLSNKLNGPDHKASLNPLNFEKMVSNIRNTEIALGSIIKKVSFSEQKNIDIVRKSIVAIKDINKGDKFTENNLSVKRPGGGISPVNYFKLIGKISKKNYKKDQQI